jgi:hypothetical protein
MAAVRIALLSSARPGPMEPCVSAPKNRCVSVDTFCQLPRFSAGNYGPLTSHQT